jgi:hypothetical protein
VASFELYLGDTNFSVNWRRNSLTVTEALRVEGSTLAVTIVRPKGDANPIPVEGQLIRFYHMDVLQFAGRVATVSREQNGGPEDFSHEISCVDFTSDFDRHLIQQTFESGSADGIVRALIGAVGFGFGAEHVDPGAAILAIEADLEFPSALMSRVAESIEYQWYIDKFRQIHFFYIESELAPMPEINFDQDPGNTPDEVPSDLSETNDWSQVKNVIWIRGAQAKSGVPYSQVDNLNFEGDQTFYALGYQPWGEDSATITVDGVPQEILLDGVDGVPGDGQGEAGQVYLCMDNWGVRFPDNHAPGSLGNPAEVAADYSYSYDPVIRVEDPESIEYLYGVENHPSAPSDGMHEIVYQVPQMRVEDEGSLWEYGQLLLARYAKIRRTITFDSLKQGWAPGQYFRAYSAFRGFDQTFYIHSVTKRIFDAQATNPRFQYTITASNLPFPG